MAAVLYIRQNDSGMSTGPPFSQSLMIDLDSRDVSSRGSHDQTRSNNMAYGSAASPSYAASNDNPALRNGVSADSQIRPGSWTAPSDSTLSMQARSQAPNSEVSRDSLSYSLHANGTRPVVERYSLGETVQKMSSSNSPEIKQSSQESDSTVINKDQDDITSMSSLPSDVASLSPAAPGQLSLPTAGVDANANAAAAANGDCCPPVIPLSASPGYNPPIYITKGSVVQANPVISNKKPPPQQEPVVLSV
jgi:hypothetical protein